MSERINAEYVFSKYELEIISNNFSSYTDWDKIVFSRVKKNIVEHLREQQDNQCCYCKRELGFDIKNVDIEHIIPKSKFSAFTFHPKNLALSCPGCNTTKGTNSVLKNEKIIRYPYTSSNFNVVHAHFDEYSPHIEIMDGCVYSANTKKGSETITKCGLYRLKFVEENAKKYAADKSSISILVEELRDSKPEDVKVLTELLKKYI